MNKESNSYTLIYAGIMVAVVALALAVTSEILRPRQAKNEAIDKMRQILLSVNAPSTNANAESLFAELIVDSYVINSEGNKIEGDAFDIELVDELRKPIEDRKYPVFEAIIDGNKKYILSLRGAGLWGAIWGFISLDEDKNTIYGVSFSHEGETPGLGSEIDTPEFAQEFFGKKIFNPENQFTSIAIVKPGKTAQGQDYVDGISGGTITCQGVETMLFSSLKVYEPFLIKK